MHFGFVQYSANEPSGGRYEPFIPTVAYLFTHTGFLHYNKSGKSTLKAFGACCFRERERRMVGRDGSLIGCGCIPTSGDREFWAGIGTAFSANLGHSHFVHRFRRGCSGLWRSWHLLRTNGSITEASWHLCQSYQIHQVVLCQS